MAAENGGGIHCMKFFSAVLLLLAVSCAVPPTEFPLTFEPTELVVIPTVTQIPVQATIILPPKDHLYHGVYPGGKTGDEDDLTLEDLTAYEATVGKSAAWVYFSNNWYHSREFPMATATWIRGTGSIPYIRLMLRSSLKHDGNEPVFTLQNIINGQFDNDLHAWCAWARDFGTQLLVEYGTEVNSDSFAWSGISNGAGTTDGYGDPAQPDGPERFKDAYRHIIQICRDEGAGNITWVFHIDGEGHPEDDWNNMENYYPGDEWVDWIGVSIYGTYTPQNSYFSVFSLVMDAIYPRIVALARQKPIIVAEFGTAKNNPLVDQSQWARDALTDITSDRYPNLIGFSWWNEWWQNDGDPAHDTTMRVQDNPELARVFQEFVGTNPKALGAVVP
jgi:hypothetical protein